MRIKESNTKEKGGISRRHNKTGIMISKEHISKENVSWTPVY